MSYFIFCPTFAMLSFSTCGSAGGPAVDKIAGATQILNKDFPDINVVGELQFDAAIDSQIALKKGIDLAGAQNCNCFVFPDLNSGNIGDQIRVKNSRSGKTVTAQVNAINKVLINL